MLFTGIVGLRLLLCHFIEHMSMNDAYKSEHVQAEIAVLSTEKSRNKVKPGLG